MAVYLYFLNHNVSKKMKLDIVLISKESISEKGVPFTRTILPVVKKKYCLKMKWD